MLVWLTRYSSCQLSLLGARLQWEGWNRTGSALLPQLSVTCIRPCTSPPLPRLTSNHAPLRSLRPSCPPGPHSAPPATRFSASVLASSLEPSPIQVCARPFHSEPSLPSQEPAPARRRFAFLAGYPDAVLAALWICLPRVRTLTIFSRTQSVRGCTRELASPRESAAPLSEF